MGPLTLLLLCCPAQAAVFYACFWTLYRIVFFVILSLIYKGYDVGYCLYLFFTVIVYGFLLPATVVMTLKRDAEYWQGIIVMSFADKFPMIRTPSEADIRTPLLGTSFDKETAVTLAGQMDEMVCEQISFAHLQLSEGNKSQQSAILGAGGTARVFKGKYRQEDVAIKMLYCMTLTPDTVENFFQESALLSRLRHPNIVHVIGVCVLPPSICMVMELCKGSLFECLRLPGATYEWGARLTMGIDCARAVSCLHAQKPAIVHMDIKSANFLLGYQKVPSWTVKDVQQWLITCGLNEFCPNFYRLKMDGQTLIRHDETSLRQAMSPRLVRHAQFPQLVAQVDDLVSGVDVSGNRDVVKMTDLELSQCDEEGVVDVVEAAEAVIDVPQTVNWTAPEVIRGGKAAYTPAADVYSLTMVLWELLSGQVPFDEPGIGPSDVATVVLDQKRRPPIADATPPEYANLLRRGWDHDPSRRPSANTVVSELLLMRRRWRANRTLDSGRFLMSPGSAPSVASEESFLGARFAAADDDRKPFDQGSGHSMGSLSNLSQAGVDAPAPTREEVMKRWAASPADGPKTGPARKGSHKRAYSDGNIADFKRDESPNLFVAMHKRKQKHDMEEDYA